MPHDPWTILGWLITGLLVLAIIAAPFVFWQMLRLRARALREHAAYRNRVFELRERALAARDRGRDTPRA